VYSGREAILVLDVCLLLSDPKPHKIPYRKNSVLKLRFHT
jgi:hypothetical protein